MFVTCQLLADSVLLHGQLSALNTMWLKMDVSLGHWLRYLDFKILWPHLLMLIMTWFAAVLLYTFSYVPSYFLDLV